MDKNEEVITPESLERYFGPRWMEAIPFEEYIVMLVLKDMEWEDPS